MMGENNDWRLVLSSKIEDMRWNNGCCEIVTEAVAQAPYPYIVESED